MEVKKITTYLLVFLLAIADSAASYADVRSGQLTPPRLTPVTGSQGRDRISLDGTWWITPDATAAFTGLENTKDWPTVNVPGEWVMQGITVKPGDSAGYVRRIQIPGRWSGRRVKLRCNGVYSYADVIINGKQAGTHKGGFTPFEIDVTGLLNFGTNNTIAMKVANETPADSAASGTAYAVHQLGGITRSISLVALPPVNISMLHTSTSFTDTSRTTGRLRAEVTVANETSRWVDNLNLHFTLRDRSGNVVALQSPDINIGGVARDDSRTLETVFDVPVPEKWDPEHPNLYTLTCTLSNGGRTISSAERRVGFRQIEIQGNRMLVNGRPVKLRGVCRHETSPDRGRSLTPGMWRNDVELFRRGNVNYIRTTHYPPDEALLDAADELGMFVEVEAPLCWSHRTEVKAADHRDVYVNQHLEMVNAFRSHPSVIIWSLGNESVNFDDYLEAAAAIKEIDPSRPRNFSQWGPDADKGTLEIANHHYPGPQGPEQYRNYARPVVFDEYCHINAYNRLELSADPGLRDMWGEMLDRMWSDMYNSEGVLGGAIWVGIDDTFFLPDGRTVGYGTWGTVDGWRREKPEYWGMKKAYSPVRLEMGENAFDGSTLTLQAENRHTFTDLGECLFRWETGKVCGETVATLAPGMKGEIAITLPPAARNADEVMVSVIGSRGFEVDRYRFALRAKQPARERRKRVKPSLKKLDDGSLTVKSGDLLFNIDAATGALTSSHGSRRLLTGGPWLMVLPLNNEGEGVQMTGRDQTFAPYTPVCGDWKLTSINAVRSKNEVTVTIEGQYDVARGSFIYRFDSYGGLTVDYDFSMTDSISPRQTGVVFAAPAGLSTLEWERRGYWNEYPADHIGGIRGTAVAAIDSIPLSGLAGPAVRPSWSWSNDRTTSGSNNFRSTKRNIKSASLSDPDGLSKITVTGDGTQHLRAWVDDACTRFLVAGYTNGGSDTYLASHAQLDYRPLIPGDRVRGSVNLKFR